MDYFSILESGYILTQNRVITYFKDENEKMQLNQIPLRQIIGVKLLSKSHILNQATYKIRTRNRNRWMELNLSSEKKR